ncbi:GL25907 [Drosophila persimilis]|uniref:GL25907 n=1 Tax=Drosophila persimilis TaxID=7234 RepID=B4GJM5_DROPE|nr:GL25907 [Drosophila persimilis]
MKDSDENADADTDSVSLPVPVPDPDARLRLELLHLSDLVMRTFAGRPLLREYLLRACGHRCAHRRLTGASRFTVHSSLPFQSASSSSDRAVAPRPLRSSKRCAPGWTVAAMMPLSRQCVVPSSASGNSDRQRYFCFPGNNVNNPPIHTPPNQTLGFSFETHVCILKPNNKEIYLESSRPRSSSLVSIAKVLEIVVDGQVKRCGGLDETPHCRLSDTAAASGVPQSSQEHISWNSQKRTRSYGGITYGRGTDGEQTGKAEKRGMPVAGSKGHPGERPQLARQQSCPEERAESWSHPQEPASSARWKPVRPLQWTEVIERTLAVKTGRPWWAQWSQRAGKRYSWPPLYRDPLVRGIAVRV